MLRRNIFFIAGCQRSGTTLMRLILESHSKINCYDESEGYKILINPPFRDVLQTLHSGCTGFKIPRFSEQLLQEDMQDIDYGTFPSFYEFDPVIFMVRDCRDVIHSMKSLKYEDCDTWLMKYGKSILLAKANGDGFSDENREYLRVIEKEGFPSHLIGALYWKYKTESVFDLIDTGAPTHIISYEDLVCNPSKQLRRVVEFLNLQWEECLLKHHLHDHEEIDEHGLAIGGTNPRLAIHANSVRKHEEYFSSQQLIDIDGMISGTLDRLASIGIQYD